MPVRPSHDQKQAMIKLAATGSVMHLNMLDVYILAWDDYDINICTAMIHLLDPSCIPTSFDASGRYPTSANGRSSLNPTDTAEHVVQIFFSVCRGLSQSKTQSNTHEKSTAARFFTTHYPHILPWLKFLVEKGYRSSGFLMLEMSSLHRGLQQEIVTSRSEVGLILAAAMREPDRRYAAAFVRQICPFVQILQKVVHHEAGKVVLYDLFRTSPSELKQLSRNMIHWIEDIARASSRNQMTSSFALSYVLTLLDIVAELLEEITHWAVFLESEGLMSALPPALLAITQTDPNLNLEDLVKCLHHIVNFCFNGGMGTIDPVRVVCTAIQAGALKVVCKCLIKLPPSHPKFSFALHVLGDFCAYVVYAPVAPYLKLVERDTISFANIQSLSARSPEFLHLIHTIDAATSLATTLSNRNGGRKTGSQICDNLNHHRSSQANLQGNEANLKQCSRCHATLYCSRECQRADWDKYHRLECDSETRRYIHESSLGVSLSARTRLQLFAYIEAFCKVHDPVFESIRESKGLSLQLHSLVIFIDHVSLPPGIDVAPHSTYTKGLTKGRLLHHTERTQGYLARSLQTREVYLIEAPFPYGACTVRVFARVRKEGNGVFHVLGAMARMMVIGGEKGRHNQGDVGGEKGGRPKGDVGGEEGGPTKGKTARQLRDYQAGQLMYAD